MHVLLKAATAGLALALAFAAPVYADDATLIAKVKTNWRAQDGETVEQIFARAAKIAHFVARGWEVGQKSDAGEPVFFSWAKHKSDKPDDEYTITWYVADDGKIALDTPYAKTMELGWQAFAVSLIANEIADEENGANVHFLHELSNFNFLATPQGPLGDLLKRGRCVIVDPVGLDYVPALDEKQPNKKAFWRLQLSVNCDISGPKYFTHEGVVLFEKQGEEAWQPQSFFARRIATYPPNSWFEKPDSKEHEIFEIGRKAFEKSGRLPPGTPSPFPR